MRNDNVLALLASLYLLHLDLRRIDLGDSVDTLDAVAMPATSGQVRQQRGFVLALLAKVLIVNIDDALVAHSVDGILILRRLQTA